MRGGREGEERGEGSELGCGQPNADRCLQDMMKFKEAGDSIRKKSFHRLNPRGSRSHTVFSIHFGVAKRGASGGQDRGSACAEVSQGSLHLVDLAGFEDFSESSFGDMEEEQLLETAAINKSIGALRIVLNKLASRQRCHVPYDSCLLTKVLQVRKDEDARSAVPRPS